MLGPAEIFTLFLVTLGPLKALGPFAVRTRGLPDERMHRIALWAFVIATVGVVIGVLLGQFLADKWHISLPAMTLAAGIVFFLVALRQLMEQYDTGGASVPEPLPDSSIAAGAKLVFPIVLTPYGIAAAITLLVASEATERTVTILLLLVSVMCLDLLAMWFARRILTGLAAIALRVLGAVLAVLQVGLAIQLVLVALRSLHIVSG
jgi:multiple antibiotic resistance protein